MLLIVEREVAKQVDKLVQERVATHIPQDEVARSRREPPQHQPHLGSHLPHTGLPMSPRNLPSALQAPSTPTLSHTIASPLHPPPHLSTLVHSSDIPCLTSPPLSSSTTFISEERKEKGEREEQERSSKLVEETQFRLEEEAAAKAMAETFSEPEEREEAELEARKGDGKDGPFEDGKTTSINPPKSGPLDLTSIGYAPASSVVAARFIADIATVSYPEGYQGPHPDLNQNVKNGKFRYR
jgi:hypothetical protein